MNGNLTAGPLDSADAVLAAVRSGSSPRPSSPGPSPAPGSGPRRDTTGGRTAPLPRREPSGLRLVGIPVWQLVAVEVLLAGVGLAAGRSAPVLAAVAVVAVAGLGAVLGRRAHRPLLAWVPVRLHRRARQRRRPGEPQGDPRLEPLREVLPALELGGIALREGQQLAVCFDGAGWSAVVGLHRESDVLPAAAPAPRLPMAVLAEVLQVDDIPLASVQVLVHTVPAPDSRLPETAPAVMSCRQLGGPWAPAVRETFVVLRLDAHSGREAIEARGGGDDGARRALKRSTSRLLELLESASVPARPLAETPWLAAVLDVAGLTATAAGPAGPAAPTGPPASAAPPVPSGPPASRDRRPREDRHLWQAGELTQLTWWVRDFPDTPAPLQTLVDLAAQVPAATTQVSFTLHRAATPGAPRPTDGHRGVPTPTDPPRATSGVVRCRALLRTAARSPEAAETVASLLGERAAALGVGIVRLDGEHGPGYLSTLPLGGGAL